LFKDKIILGLICARGGSKGVPKKNIKPLGGNPLICWSVKIARQCPYIDKIVVSTDDTSIAAIAKEHGAEVPFIRPAPLAEDNSPEWLVWQHAIRKLAETENFTSDYLIVLPPTSPFRSIEDVNRSIELIDEENIDIVISVTHSNRNPYFNMVELDTNGFASLSKRPERHVYRRQDAPRVFDMTTVLYTAKIDFILNANGVFDGRVKALEIPETRALDIDTEMDFKFAEYLISDGLVEFNENCN
jgi:N,N'-diacetyl-8-epilegionaminate cytidylyltransferase